MSNSQLILLHVPACFTFAGLYIRHNIQHLSDFIKLFYLFHKRSGAPYRSTLFMFFLVILPLTGRAGIEDQALGSRWQAMAGAGVADSCLREPLSQNPSAMAFSPGWNLGCSYFCPFAIKEMATWEVGVQYAGPRTGFGVSMRRFGYQVYQESVLTVGASWKMYSKVAVGMSLRYAHVQIQRYGAAGCLLLDMGVLASCSERLRFGFMAKNINDARIGACRESLPQLLQSGFSVLMSEGTTLCLDLCKEIQTPPELRLGVDHLIGEQFSLRAGFHSMDMRLSAGFAILLGFFSLEYSAMTHPYLGMTHQFSIYSLFKRTTQ